MGEQARSLSCEERLPEGGARQGQPAVGVLGLSHSVAPCYPVPPRTMTESGGGTSGEFAETGVQTLFRDIVKFKSPSQIQQRLQKTIFPLVWGWTGFF